MKIGYARVSTIEQNLNLQRDALKAAGCNRIIEDKASGGKVKRDGLERTRELLRPGDVLAVWRLDRLGLGIANGQEPTLGADRWFSSAPSASSEGRTDFSRDGRSQLESTTGPRFAFLPRAPGDSPCRRAGTLGDPA
jgi:hypothetical protein